MSKNKKGQAVICDMDANQALVIADLTLAATKRFMKEYKKLGFNVGAVFNGEEVVA